MLFRLALAHGIPDWRALGHTIPEETFAGWQDYYDQEPFGQNHLYDFLSRAFYYVCQSLHNPEFARDIRPHDFKYWAEETPADRGIMTEADIESSLRRWDNVQKAQEQLTQGERPG